MPFARRVVFVAAVVLAVAVPCETAAQSTPDFWAGVNDLHRLKTAFVDALRSFAESAAGSYGDEGAALSRDLANVQTSLDSWDRAIAAYESTSRAATRSADAHAALGAAYLDRFRLSDAIAELTAASRLDAHRADIHALNAMAYEATGDSRRARAERDAAAADAPSEVVAVYLAAAIRADEDSPEAHDAQRRVDATHSAADNAPIQFDRVGLVRQVPGTAPIFPPQRYVSGFRLIEGGRYTDGVSALRQAVASDPLAASAPDSRAAVAGARLRRGQMQAALSELRQSATPPTDAEAARVLGVAYWADEQTDRSVEALTTAVRLNPKDERARIALVDVLRQAGKSGDAERLLKETLASLPDSGQAHYRLAQLYQSESLVADAAAEFEVAVTCAPLVGLDYLYDTLGGLYATQADFGRAIGAYRRRLGVDPNNADAHLKLGQIYALDGRDDAALAEFDIAQRLDPRKGDALAEAGRAYLRLSRMADAVRVSRQSLALDPANQHARFTLGTALVRLGSGAEGQRELDAFQRDVDNTAGLRRRALEARMLERDAARAEAAGDFTQAATLLQRALDMANDETRLELRLGRVLLSAGQPDEALRHLGRVGPSEDQAEVHKIAAQAYAALGQPDTKAREDTLYRQIVERRKEERLKTQPLLR
jgi:superkiller protein 3